MNALLAKYPALHVETILDEWNMALTVPPQNPSIQPAFVVETAWRMKQSNLTYSCFYHIRDYHVDRYRFASFFSPGGASFMANWWNRMPQYSGCSTIKMSCARLILPLSYCRVSPEHVWPLIPATTTCTHSFPSTRNTKSIIFSSGISQRSRFPSP